MAISDFAVVRSDTITHAAFALKELIVDTPVPLIFDNVRLCILTCLIQDAVSVLISVFVLSVTGWRKQTQLTKLYLCLADVCSDLSSEYSVNIHVLSRRGMSSIICRCCTSSQQSRHHLRQQQSATWSRTIPVSCRCVGKSDTFCNMARFLKCLLLRHWGLARRKQVLRRGGEEIVWVEFDCPLWFHYFVNASTTITTNPVAMADVSFLSWNALNKAILYFQGDRIGKGFVALTTRTSNPPTFAILHTPTHTQCSVAVDSFPLYSVMFLRIFISLGAVRVSCATRWGSSLFPLLSRVLDCLSLGSFCLSLLLRQCSVRESVIANSVQVSWPFFCLIICSLTYWM
jgi:hypothetical protein